MATGGATVFEGSIISVDVEMADLPNGRRLRMEIVRHPGGAAVVALDDAGKVCLLKQYRHVVNSWLWELPAGKIDQREPPLNTARRELEEEAGVRAALWDELGSMISSPGVFTEEVHLYLARGLTQGVASAEDHEIFEVHWLPFNEALEGARCGEIMDAKSVIGLFRAQALIRIAASDGE